MGISRSENMRRIRSKDTAPEMAVRRLVHGLGYRYRLHRKDLPGNPDLVFSSRRKVIFVHGCFWHQHENSSCKITNTPKTNLEYWLPKLERTKQRDEVNQHKLKETGWDVLVIWECEIETSLDKAAKRIDKFLSVPTP
jgi:DNA mismatch endonuclease (patch repair protein)